MDNNFNYENFRDNLIGNDPNIGAPNASVDELIDASMRDGLTGLHNRAYLDEKISAIKSNDNVAVVMIDIDKFKDFNDSYGHGVGDQVLKSMSRILQSNFQIIESADPDVVARYGGEEFTVIVKNINDHKRLVTRLNEVRKKIEKNVIDPDKTNIKFTASFGVAFSDGKLKGEELLLKADKALYSAKQSGRNRVIVAQSH